MDEKTAIKSDDVSTQELLSALESITSRGKFGWDLSVQGVRVGDSAPLDYEIKLAHYDRNETTATRRIAIKPSWSIHPRYGEPDVFLGYRVIDSDMSHYDDVYAEHLTFREAIETVGGMFISGYGRRPKRVSEWRSTRRYETIEDNENFDELKEAASEAIDELVEYTNRVKMDKWDEITREEAMSGEHRKKEILGRAKEEGLVDFHDLADLSLVLDTMLFETHEVEA